MKYIKSNILSNIPSVTHGFIYLENSLNINDFSEKMGLEKIKTIKQIHSNEIVHLNDVNKYENSYEADAIVSDLKGYGVGVYTADCVPIIIIDTYNGYFGVIHAGWKGTLSGITEKVSDYLISELDCKSENIKAAIGPCIEGRCYEIGEEIADQFEARFKNSNFYLTKKEGTKYNLDLRKANIKQLNNKGITSVEIVDICTKCDLNYPSYRRDGKNAGRMLSFIGFI